MKREKARRIITWLVIASMCIGLFVIFLLPMILWAPFFNYNGLYVRVDGGQELNSSTYVKFYEGQLEVYFFEWHNTKDLFVGQCEYSQTGDKKWESEKMPHKLLEEEWIVHIECNIEDDILVEYETGSEDNGGKVSAVKRSHQPVLNPLELWRFKWIVWTAKHHTFN